MQRLTRRELTREQYAESLAAMYRPHVQLERLVHQSRHHFESGLELSPRIELLKADLIDLGWPVPAVPPTPPDPLDGRAAWWGRVYVLEGSRQGSVVIARCIRSSLFDTVPCRFFGEVRMSDDYNSLLATLERELGDHEALAQAVASARAAFALYKTGLDALESRHREVELR